MEPTTNSEPRTYLYQQFPEPEHCAACEDTVGGKALVKSWENEKYAWQDGEIASCCGYGALYRCQYIAGTSITIPANLCMAISALGCTVLCGTCATLYSVEACLCCSVSCCCEEAFGSVVDRAIASWKAAFSCLKCAGNLSFNMGEVMVCCLPNIVAEECVNSYCGQPERMLKAAEENKEALRKMRNMDEWS